MGTKSRAQLGDPSIGGFPGLQIEEAADNRAPEEAEIGLDRRSTDEDLTGFENLSGLALAGRNDDQGPETARLATALRGYGGGLTLMLGPAKSAWQKFIEHGRRLYEQGAYPSALGGYIRRWLGWLGAGIGIDPVLKSHDSSFQL